MLLLLEQPALLLPDLENFFGAFPLLYFQFIPYKPDPT